VTWTLLSIPKDKPTISLNPTGLDLPQPQFSIRDTLRFGRMGVLTPWGVLTFGGRSGTAHYMDPPVVWRVCAFTPPFWDLCVTACNPGTPALAVALVFTRAPMGFPSVHVQKSLTSDRWYSVNPPPVEDRRHKFPNPWKDPNHDNGVDHLYLDFEYSARVGLSEMPPVLPKRRVLPAMCFIGEANTRTRLRGVDQAKLVIFGGCVPLGEGEGVRGWLTNPLATTRPLPTTVPCSTRAGMMEHSP
jgi:hypothetical protein